MVNSFAGQMRIKNNIHLVSWMWKHTKGKRLTLFISVFIGLFRIVASLSFVWISKEMIDIASYNKMENLYVYALSLSAVLIFEIILSALYSYIEVQLEAGVRSLLMRSTFVRAVNSVWNGKEKWHSGDVVNRLEEDVRLVSNSMCSVLPGLAITAVQFIAAFIFLSYINPELAWIIVFIMPVFLVVSFFIARRMKRLTKEIRETDGKIQSVIQESLQKRIVLLALMRVKHVYSKLVYYQEKFIEQSTERNRFSVVSRMAVMFGFGAGYLTAFIWGVSHLHDGLITFGMLSAFLQLVGQIQRPTADMSRKIPYIIHSLASAERLLEIYSSEQEEIDEAVSSSMENPYCGIRFENVTFSYKDSDRKIISGFSYDFKPGSSTAIVGETGAGKSTMMRLMLGLLKPESGIVYLYTNDNYKMIASSRTRLDVIYVPQGNSLLSGTIRENLIAGNGLITDDEIDKAIYLAAAEFVYELPEGLDTICGEGGEGLSEGQAQRIAIARGLLSRGNIILLDEFTSALDSETEKKLMNRLTREVIGKTIVFITHRKDIADMCSNILHINKSSIK